MTSPNQAPTTQPAESTPSTSEVQAVGHEALGGLDILNLLPEGTPVVKRSLSDLDALTTKWAIAKADRIEEKFGTTQPRGGHKMGDEIPKSPRS